jgi:hypothetical protein
MAVFCSEFKECLPGVSSRNFLRPLVTVPVAPMTTGITEHFMFYIAGFLYFTFFSASLCVTSLSDGTDTAISAQSVYFLFIFSLFYYDYYIIAINRLVFYFVCLLGCCVSTQINENRIESNYYGFLF